MKLVKEISTSGEKRAKQLVSYGNKTVGFYDVEKTVAGKKVVKTYVYIENINDPFSIVRREAKKVRVVLNGESTEKDEKDLYKRAYDLYKELKENGGFVDKEKEDLAKKNAELQTKLEELQASAKVKPAPVIKKK